MDNSTERVSNIKSIVLNDSGPIKIITSSDIKKAISMKEAIGLMSLAFSSFSDQQCYVPPRYVNDIPEKNLTIFFKPAYMQELGRTGIKILCQNENNSSSCLPTIMGIILLIDGDTGQILSIMDGSYLTALRTGAASGLATEYLAREDAETLAIFGCGVQGRTQLEAITEVRNIKQVFIYDIDRGAAERYLKEMQKEYDLEITYSDDLNQLRKADIICTTTNSRSPLFNEDYITEGVHINAIGSYKPHMQEIDPKIVRKSKLYVDSIESCISESGDIIIPVKDGIISKDHIIGEIGSVILGKAEGRKSEKDITIFKSVGIAIQDLVVANEAYQRLTGNYYGKNPDGISPTPSK